MAGPGDSAEGIALTLTHDEALVLFEWLRSNEAKLVFSDQAEQRVLWNLEASLEPQVAALLSPEYDRLLDAARSRLRESRD